jgi:hypothetical protein
MREELAVLQKDVLTLSILCRPVSRRTSESHKNKQCFDRSDGELMRQTTTGLA